MASLNEKLLISNEVIPESVATEAALLGALIHDYEAMNDILLFVRGGEDFYKAAHRDIFEAARSLWERTSSIDLNLLNEKLKESKALADVGGEKYLLELAESVPGGANAVHYARIVRDKSMLRRLKSVTSEIVQDIYQSQQEDQAEDIIARAEQRVYDIAGQNEMRQVESIRDLLTETMKVLESREGSHLTGSETGFDDLDEMLGGLQSGEMIILAARPSMGKTALALNIGTNMIMKGIPTAVFSLEMGGMQLAQRMISSYSGVRSDRIRKNILVQDEYQAMFAACGELQDKPLYIDDTPGLTMVQLRAKARRLKNKHKIEVIIIDYLQLMTSGRRSESRQQEVSELSRNVKAMARELNVPVLCLSQLNRAAEQREGHRPRMSDLRESGSLEQDADVVLMLHREEYYHKSEEDWIENNPERANLAELIVAKQRNGPTGVVKLHWDGEKTLFSSYSAAREPVGYNISSPNPSLIRMPQENELPPF